MQTEPLERSLVGAAAGLAATIPMTAVIALCQSRMPPVDRLTPPPPHQIAMEVASALGLKSHLELDEKLLFSLLTHFGYGAGAGALYGFGTRGDESSPGGRGIAFGCLVWAGSYLGWLQAAGFRAAADGQSLRRNGMMLAAHVVWGWTLGTLYDRFGGSAPLRRCDRQLPPGASVKRPVRPRRTSRMNSKVQVETPSKKSSNESQ